MLPPQRILACTDFSAGADSAVARAARLAADYGAELQLLHVLGGAFWRDAAERLGALMGHAPLSEAQALQTAQRRLEEMVNRLALVATPACHVRTTSGRPAHEICRAALDLKIDLLVTGAAGAHATRDLLLGTTTQKLLRTAPCPVLVSKQPPRHAYGTVLLPTDFSAHALATARAARALLPQAIFHLVHAFELPYEGLMNYAGVEASAVSHYVREAEVRLQPALAEFVKQAGFTPGRALTELKHGYPPNCIDDWLRRKHADLVTLAAHGKSELQETLLGSVSLHVSQSARCDVLLMRGSEFL